MIFKVFLCPSYSSAVAVASCTMRARSTLFSLYRSMLSAVTGWAKRRSFMEEGSEGNGWRGRKEDRWSLVDTPLCQGRENPGVRGGGRVDWWSCRSASLLTRARRSRPRHAHAVLVALRKSNPSLLLFLLRWLAFFLYLGAAVVAPLVCRARAFVHSSSARRID